MKKHNIFAPASPAFSSRAGVSSSAARKPSLRASETGMGFFYEQVLFLFTYVLDI